MIEPHVTCAAGLGSSEWGLLEDAVAQLENAWQKGTSADLAQFVPPLAHPQRLRILTELIKVDQELQWQIGAGKKLEAYLAEWPEVGEVPALVSELIESERLARGACGAPALDELQARFRHAAEDADLPAVLAGGGSSRSSRNSMTMDTVTPPNPGGGDGEVPSLAEGCRLGRYVVRRILGRGGMATVYLAEDEELAWQVAVKVPRLDQFRSKRDMDLFLEEARTVVKLRHQGIVGLHGLDRLPDGTPYAILDYIDGGSLRERP